MSAAYRIAPDDLTGGAVKALLAAHLEEMHAWSPACKVHALPVERLREKDVSFYAVWAGDDLAAIGALKALDAERCEIKSMRASPEFRGKGAGEAILLALLKEAVSRGYRWVGLETGGTEQFVPARRLYEKHGFAECPAFDDYVSDEFSLCMEKWL